MTTTTDNAAVIDITKLTMPHLRKVAQKLGIRTVGVSKPIVQEQVAKALQDSNDITSLLGLSAESNDHVEAPRFTAVVGQHPEFGNLCSAGFVADEEQGAVITCHKYGAAKKDRRLYDYELHAQLICDLLNKHYAEEAKDGPKE